MLKSLIVFVINMIIKLLIIKIWIIDDSLHLILYLTERYFISELTLFYIRLSGSR